MGTRREWLSVQFGITDNDKAEDGLIAALSATLAEATVKDFCESKNRFTRSVGKAIVALGKAELPTDLVKEKDALGKAIDTNKELLAAMQGNAKKELASTRKALQGNGMGKDTINAMLHGLELAQVEKANMVQGDIASSKARITEIDLTPIQGVNNAFLDTMAKTHTKSTGNGVRNVSGTVHVVHMAEGDYFVAVEDNKTWRVYDSEKKPLFDNTDCPNVTIASKTKARKVVYVWQYKTAFGKANDTKTVNKADYRLVNAGGVGADGELIELHSDIASFSK